MILDSTPNPIPEQDSKYANWRDLDLNTRDGMNALQRVIAFRVGWRIVPHTPLYGEENDPADFRAAYDLLDPDGKIILYGYSDYGLRYWESLPQVPNWPKNAGQALSLFDNVENVHLNMYRVFPGEWRVGYTVGDYTYRPGFGSYYTTAVAICYAWLAYTDARQQARAQEGASDE